MPPRVALAGLGVALLAAMALGLLFGSVPVATSDVVDVIVDRLTLQPPVNAADPVVWRIRVPRVLLAAVVGAALATVGALMQVLVRNALADPYLLGVSSGASVGATAVLLFGALAGFGVWALAVGGVAGAAGAMLLVFALAQRGGRLEPVTLLLSGVAVSAVLSAVASFLLFAGDPRAAQAVLFWLLGSFGSANWEQLPLPALALLVSMVVSMALARSLNALALGEDVAASVGVPVARVRGWLFALTTLTAGIAVSVAGVIGFLGLVVPHIARLLVGSDHRSVLPVGMLLGALFGVVGDLVARTLVAPQEMPMGVVTAVIGGPLLLVLMRRRLGAPASGTSAGAPAEAAR